jgi:hypothetical protein
LSNSRGSQVVGCRIHNPDKDELHRDVGAITIDPTEIPDGRNSWPENTRIVGNEIYGRLSPGIHLDGDDQWLEDVIVAHNTFHYRGAKFDPEENDVAYHVRIDDDAGVRAIIESNSMVMGTEDGVAVGMNKLPTEGSVRGNVGFDTDAAGTARIESGATHTTVNHGMDVSLRHPREVTLTPASDLGAASTCWVSDPAAEDGAFRINLDTSPETAVEVHWQAQVGPVLRQS